MSIPQTEEIAALLIAINQKYGYDFSQYSYDFLITRIKKFTLLQRYQSIRDLQEAITTSRNVLIAFIDFIMIPVTELFRDPYVFGSLQKNVFSYIKTFSQFKIWHAGCSTGEEVFSLAILLKENDLLKKATIYGTDINPNVLEKARRGILSPNVLQHAAKKYLEAGGQHSLTHYFTTQYDNCLLNEEILSKLVFAEHNLATDSCFGEMNMILCRNVLIYFNRELQQHVFKLFLNSLTHDGFLCLGTNESVALSESNSHFMIIDMPAKIYQRVPETADRWRS